MQVNQRGGMPGRLRASKPACPQSVLLVCPTRKKSRPSRDGPLEKAVLGPGREGEANDSPPARGYGRATRGVESGRARARSGLGEVCVGDVDAVVADVGGNEEAGLLVLLGGRGVIVT